MDTVFVTGLRVDTVIGVYDWERTIRQTVVLDLEMAWDNRPAAAGDDVNLALDYAQVSGRVIAFIEGSEFQLIETMAEQVAQLIRSEFKVAWLRLRLAKPGAVAAALEVGVQIERGARD
jgi:7,8-dihydroneopterin aldolase/epimerase/oxygenase